MAVTTAEIIAGELQKAGVRHVFGHPGGEVVELIEALEKAGVSFVLMGHESAAAFAAGTTGLASGVPGVCLATLGPGACNLVLGVADALLDRHPMLAISARTAESQLDWYIHQHLALNDLFAPISKESLALTGNGTAAAIRQALSTAKQSPRGPVYLTLPGEVAAGVERSPEAPAADTGTSSDRLSEDVLKKLDVIAAALNQAQKPVAVVGVSLDLARDAAAIRDFLERTGLPYADTPKTKGLVDPASPTYLGTFLSASGDAVINEFIRGCDCILGIGYDPIEALYDWHLNDSYCALVDGPTAYGSFKPRPEAIGDVSVMVRHLADSFEGRPVWQPADFEEVRSQVQQAIRPGVEASDRGLAPYVVAMTLNEVAPRGTRLTLDVGQHKMIFAQNWKTNRPLSFFNSNGLSSMGCSVPGAIALSLLEAGSPVICVTGDGGFGMMVQELETIRRLRIHPLIVVLCDERLSLIRLPQRMRGFPARGIDFAPVDWAQVARGFGLRSRWINTLAELREAVALWREQPEATVLAVRVDDGLYRGNNY